MYSRAIWAFGKNIRPDWVKQVDSHVNTGCLSLPISFPNKEITMSALPGNTSDIAPSGGITQRTPIARSLWRRLCLVWQSPQQAETGDKAWVTALPQILAMDAHILRDIGAPAWVISQAQQRQALRSRRPQEAWRC
jgi:hypothetical protein